MSTDETSTATPGDGEITIPIEEREANMAVDLEPGIAQALLNSAVQSHQVLMTESQGNIQHANNITRLTAAKKFDELGVVEGKTAQGVVTVPHGAPAGPNGA